MSWGVALRNGLPLGLGNVPSLGARGFQSPEGWKYKVLSCDGSVYPCDRNIVDCGGTSYFVVQPVIACNGNSYEPI
jgi:hypothetical protein